MVGKSVHAWKSLKTKIHREGVRSEFNGVCECQAGWVKVSYSISHASAWVTQVLLHKDSREEMVDLDGTMLPVTFPMF